MIIDGRRYPGLQAYRYRGRDEFILADRAQDMGRGTIAGLHAYTAFVTTENFIATRNRLRVNAGQDLLVWGPVSLRYITEQAYPVTWRQIHDVWRSAFAKELARAGYASKWFNGLEVGEKVFDTKMDRYGIIDSMDLGVGALLCVRHEDMCHDVPRGEVLVYFRPDEVGCLLRTSRAHDGIVAQQLKFEEEKRRKKQERNNEDNDVSTGV